MSENIHKLIYYLLLVITAIHCISRWCTLCAISFILGFQIPHVNC